LEKFLSIIYKIRLSYRFVFLIFLSFSMNSSASSSLSYTGRLVHSNGSPITGPVNLKLDIAYLNALREAGPVICSKELTNIPLSNGVFHLTIDYSSSDCGGRHIIDVLAEVPENESVALRVTDVTNVESSKAYSFHAIHNLPFATVASLSKTLVAPPVGTPSGHVLKWNGTKWVADAPASAGGDGSVTEIQTGSGLSGGPITNSGTISIANLGIESGHIANSAITNEKIASGIARSKLAPGSPNTIVVNDLTGSMTAVSTLPVSMGGTGATTPSQALTNLGIVVGLLPGNILGASSVPICDSINQKLLWGPGGWLCVGDKDTIVDTSNLSLAGGTLTSSVDMSGNKIMGVGTPLAGTDAATKSYVDGLSYWKEVSGAIFRETGRVGIGTDSPEAILDITSTSSGILIPRMTTAERNAISPKPIGMQIYNIETNELNYYNGTEWKALGASGTGISSLTAGTGLSGGTISTSGGTIGIAPGGVSGTELANGAVTNDKVSAGAAIDRSKLATGTPNAIVINDASGVMSAAVSLPISMGGTGASTAEDVRGNLGLGTAAVANIGTAAGNVMAANAAPHCAADEKIIYECRCSFCLELYSR